MAGAYTDQRLNLSRPWKGPRKKYQGSKPDPGNLAVRDYRGASGEEQPTRLRVLQGESPCTVNCLYSDG